MSAPDRADALAVRAHRHEVDALRGLATLLLIVFHTGMVFTASYPFHIKNDDRSLGIRELIDFVHQWHMPLFFFLAGVSAWYALRRRTSRQFRVGRVKRLFVPLVFGMLFLIPPQVYLERISIGSSLRSSPIDFDGSYLDFWPTEALRCCYPGANVSWHHLWFLMYLFVYSILLVGLFRWLGRRGESTRLAVTGFLSKGLNLLWVPALYLGAVEGLLRSRFPNNQNLISDFANHANYAVVFLLGFLVVSDQRLDGVIRRVWRWALPLGVAVILLPDVGERIDNATRGVAEWFIVVGLLGTAQRFAARPSPLIQRFSEISLPFYIWHQTVIVVLAYFIVQWDQAIATKFVVIALVSFLVTWSLSELVAKTNPTRVLFGLKPVAAPRQRAGSDNTA